MENSTLLAVAFVAVVLLALIWKLLHREKPKPWIAPTSCPQCGWKGQASRYAGRCPRCNSPIGEQRAKRG